MATVEFGLDDVGRLPLPSRSIVDGGTAVLVKVRARRWGIPTGPGFILPYGRREAGRLRFAWLLTLAAGLAPILAILAIIDFMRYLGMLKVGVVPPGLPLGVLIVLVATVVALTHVTQHPTLRRSKVIRVLAVDDRVAAEWSDLANGRIRVTHP